MLDLEDFLQANLDPVDTSNRDFNSAPIGDEPVVVVPEVVEDDEPGFDLENDPRFAEKPVVVEPVVVPPVVVPPVTTETSLIESFLERYNIVGGELETEKGEKVFYKDLTADQQLKVLGQIVDSSNSDLSSLNVEEKDLLKSVRESKLSINDYMIKSAQEFSDINSASQIYDAEGYKFETMGDDLIYSTYILSNNPDVTEEVLQEEVEHAKKSPLYASTVTGLRNSFIGQREAQRKIYTDSLIDTRVQEAKQQSIKYVNAARSLNEISGWPVTEDTKNELLESFVELDATGKSQFLKDMENPELAFKAIWFLKHGEDNFKKIDTYYKDQVQRVYAKGIEDGKAGKLVSTKRQSGVKTPDKNTNAPGVNKDDMSLEDFMHSK